MTELQCIDNKVASVLGTTDNSLDPRYRLDTPIRIDIYTDIPDKPKKLLLERWSISLVQSTSVDASMVDSLQAGYKKLVILLRAVYTQTRQLPLWAARQKSKDEVQNLQYDISAVESVTHCEGDMTEFQFGSQYTPYGRLYVSVRYRTNSLGAQQVDKQGRGLNPQLINSEYFNKEALKLVREVSAPIPINGTASNDRTRQRAFSAPTHAPITELGPDLFRENQQDDHCEDADIVPPMMVGSYNQPSNFQPHSLPPRLPTRVETLNRSVLGPALSADGVARPMDIPVDKLRHVNSRSSLEDPLDSSSRGGTPSSHGSSFGSSPYNMFGFTPPFAGATAPPIHTSSPPETSAGAISCPLVFGDTQNSATRIMPVSTFQVFSDEGDASANHEANDSGANPYSVFIEQNEQQQQEFCSEHLPFADPAGPEDHDSKIGSFVEECWNAPALQMFTKQDGQRMSQSTRSLQEELFKLRDTKERILSTQPQ